MSAVDVLLKPEECGMLFVDSKPGADSVRILRIREMIHPG